MQSTRIKNRRGDIPITILVLGVVAICAFAIISFFLADTSAKTGFDGTRIVEKANIDAEKIKVYGQLGFSDAEIQKEFNIKTGPQGKYIELQKGDVKVQYLIP